MSSLSSATSGVCAVVVSYNSVVPLERFAQEVAKTIPMLVVDNASTDGSADACAAWGIDVLRLPANLGYGTAVNRGVAALGRHVMHVLVLNPDVLLDLQTVSALRQRLEERPEIGVVAPRLRNLDGTEQLAARPFPTIGNQLIRRVGHGTINARSDGWRQHPDWVLGAALMVRRRDFVAIGGFDERFFLYCEDVDLCWRYRQAGFLVEQLEGVWADHEYERSSAHLAHVADPAVRHHWRSMVKLARKYPWEFSGMSRALHRSRRPRLNSAERSQVGAN